MKRELKSHKVNGLNEALTIEVLDEPGQGNACHVYKIHGPRSVDDSGQQFPDAQCVKFQNGPIKEFGVNGISGEALLAIVEDRLIGFQSGPFATHENQMALEKTQEAMMWLQKRTLDRLRRGVEGTNQK